MDNVTGDWQRGFNNGQEAGVLIAVFWIACLLGAFAGGCTIGAVFGQRD